MLSYLFGVTQPVSHRSYVLVGLSLMAFKYGVELAVFHFVQGHFLSPLDFANPFLAERRALLQEAPEWLPWAYVVWTMPFVWIATTMTARRCFGAGVSPVAALLLFVPYVNLLVMTAMALAPDAEILKRPDKDSHPPLLGEQREAVSTVLMFTLGAMMVVFGVSVFLAEGYGSALFIGTPLLCGVTWGLLSRLRLRILASVPVADRIASTTGSVFNSRVWLVIHDRLRGKPKQGIERQPCEIHLHAGLAN